MPNLAEALRELSEVTDYAKEDGMDIPSETAFANAERLLRDLYDFSPRVYSVYPIPDGYIAIDARGAGSNIAVLMCGSDGSALFVRVINGESRRIRYPTTGELPDEFIREALTALGPEPV